MIAVLLSLVLSQGSVGCRFDRTGERFRNCSSEYVPFFAFATASGTGMTSECGCSNPTGTKGEALTFTRASDAWCEKADFSWAKCSTNQARVTALDFNSSTLGMVVERAATNTVLRNRDFSDVAWVKTTMTCNKNATGIDGIVNSASTCTATLGGAIVAQAASCPASGAAASIFLKRVTGAGTVEVSCNGSTYYSVTPDTTWKRMSPGQCSPASRCTTQVGLGTTCASGGIYVRLGTNTDAVALDMAQCEATAKTTSPIETAGTSATRIKEAPYFSVAIGTPTAISSFSTLYTREKAPAGGTTAVTIYQSGGIYHWPYRNSSTAMTCQLQGGGTSNVTSNNIVDTSEARVGCRATTAVNNACTGGTCAASAPITPTLVSGTVQVDIGNWGANSDQTDGVIKNVCFDTTFSGCGP